MWAVGGGNEEGWQAAEGQGRGGYRGRHRGTKTLFDFLWAWCSGNIADKWAGALAGSFALGQTELERKQCDVNAGAASRPLALTAEHVSFSV